MAKINTNGNNGFYNRCKRNAINVRLLFFWIIICVQLFQGCVTPGVGKQIKDLDRYKENREAFHKMVMKDSTDFFNIVYRQNNKIGVIFDKPTKMRVAIDSAKGLKSEKYLPDTNMIAMCEREIFEKLSKGNGESKILVQPEYVIRNFDKYLRQYFGSVNGVDTLIEIRASLYEGEMSILDLFNEIDVWGGGAKYWYADCYISKRNVKIKDLGTNWIE
jgi:hypothetical protein